MPARLDGSVLDSRAPLHETTMRRPHRALDTAELPSRRSVLAVLAAAGGALVLPSSALGDAPAGASASASPAVLVLPGMGRVVLVFAGTPRDLQVSIDGRAVPASQVVAELGAPSTATSTSASPTPSPAPSAAASAPAAVPAPSTPTTESATRFGVYVPEGARHITVTASNMAFGEMSVQVREGDSIEITVPSQEPVRDMPPGGVPPRSDYESVFGGGCCGGARTPTTAQTRPAAAGASAIAMAALLLRRRPRS
jgi:hypothetical protein